MLARFLSLWKALTCLNRGYCYWWEDDPIRELVLYEKNFGWMDVWELTQKGWDRFGWWPLWLEGEIILAEGGPCPLLNYTLTFALQLRKSTGNLSQGGRVVRDNSLRRLGRLFRDSLGWPAEHQSTSVTREWLQLALGRQKCLPSSRTKGFPASANFESKLSVFRCGRRRIESPNPREFACYQRTNVR
jgi:hypothetical protein